MMIPFANWMRMHSTSSSAFYLRLWLSLWVVLAQIATGASAQTQPAPDANLLAIRAILELPDKEIDLAKAKLTIDHLIDPGVDVAGSLKQLDAMTADISARLPVNASSRDKLEALRAFMYQAGPWNGNQPFRYDLDDPFGHNIRNKLLPTYLATRIGNCVSMPFLFIILGQKLGIDVTASTAPEHVFVKYRDDMGNLYNLETTSGAGFTRDVWMQQQMPMTAQALANGIYMQPLSKKETVVVMARTLLEYYRQQSQEERLIALAGLMLEYYSRDVAVMLHTSSAYYHLMQRHFVSKYPTPNDIPSQERPYYAELGKNMVGWRGKAEALGWREPDESSNANYQQIVNRAKSVQ